MIIEHLSPQVAQFYHAADLQREVYAIYQRPDGQLIHPIAISWPKKGEVDQVVYVVARDEKQLLGHVHLDLGTQTLASKLFEDHPKNKTGLISGLTLDTNLEKEKKIELQQVFWEYLWVLAGIFSLNTLEVILSPKTAEFALETGHNFRRMKNVLKIDSVLFQQLSHDYPGYWNEKVRLYTVTK